MSRFEGVVVVPERSNSLLPCHALPEKCPKTATPRRATEGVVPAGMRRNSELQGKNVLLRRCIVLSGKHGRMPASLTHLRGQATIRPAPCPQAGLSAPPLGDGWRTVT